MQQEEKVHLKECAMQLLSNVCMEPTSEECDCLILYVHRPSIVTNGYNVVMIPVLLSSGHPLYPGGGEPRQRRSVKNNCGNDKERMASTLARYADRDGSSNWPRRKSFYPFTICFE